MQFREFIISLTLSLLIVSICSNSFAQIMPFVPPTFNYTIHNYNAGNQNWAVAQGDNRVMYIGNDYGLLSFDAVNWKLNKLPNNLSVKSILVDNSGDEERIYVGSFEEFGYFTRDDKNELIYHSLKPLIENFELHNDEIWTISKLGDEIFFQTFSSYFIYNVNSNTIISKKSFPAPLYFFMSKGKLYAQFIDEHFYVFKDGEFELLLTKDKFNNDQIVSVLSFDDELFLVTSKSGIYAYNLSDNTLSRKHTDIDDELQREIVNRCVAVSDSVFVLGTLNNGIYALSVDFTVLWHLNRDNGLNNNTVLGLLKDKDSNLWAALDNGISFIQTNSPLSFFEPKEPRIGLVEDILVRDGQIYMATNQGVYSYSKERGGIHQLPGFNVQAWFVRDFDDQIIAGYNTGTSFIEGARKVDIPEKSTGGTDIKLMQVNGKNFLLESTYTALQIYLRNDNGHWAFSHKVEGFSDLIDQVEYDHAGNIWAGHMYKGVYKLRLDDQLRQVVQQDFYLSLDSAGHGSRPIRVMKLRGRIVLTNGNWFYTYDDVSQKIIPFELLNKDLPDLTDTREIVTVNDTTFWFIRPEEYTLVEYKNNGYRVADKIPFATLNNPPNMRRGNIYVSGDNASYFCLNGGIGRYEISHNYDVSSPDLEVSIISSYNRKTDISANLPLNEKNVVRFLENNLTFEFSYTDYRKKLFTIECFLENYDTRWLPTASDYSITYSNLPAGSYVLNSRVLSDTGETVSAIAIPFIVKNPWYKTTLSIIIYILLTTLLLVYVVRSYIRRVVRRKNEQFTQQEKERLAQIERQEKLIVEMNNEKLQNELTYKSKELANATMMVINHEELLNRLKKDIQDSIISGKINRQQGASLVKMIDENLSSEDDWAIFQENFDLIQDNFFRKLTEQYPSLTPGDLRLCALLRLNYSSKEIAKMLNLTLRGVETARYRLRKKLNLEEDENLASFMINFN